MMATAFGTVRIASVESAAEQFVEVEAYDNPSPSDPGWPSPDMSKDARPRHIRFSKIEGFEDMGDHCRITHDGGCSFGAPEWHPTGVRTYGLLSLIADEVREERESR